MIVNAVVRNLSFFGNFLLRKNAIFGPETKSCVLMFALSQDIAAFENSKVHVGGVAMAKCQYCGKGVTFGVTVSHSHIRTNRPFKPNVKRVKALVDGAPKHVYVCTRCLRSGKVQRAV
jgi:large subunit ribosomal protein L28